MTTYEDDKADLIIRLFESYGVELNDGQRNVIRRELMMILRQISDDLY